MKKNQWVIIVLCVILSVIIGCSSNHVNFQKVSDHKKTKPVEYPLTERQCLMRAMYFESNRSSREGMIAVGTIVMNRVNSSAYPKTICGVVGQRKQFAPGVLTRPMLEKASVARVKEAADAVLRGERDKKSKNAMFFHTAGLSFPYKNMHYVRVVGGNAFYEKRRRDGSLQVPVNDSPYDVAFAFSQEHSSNMPNFMNSTIENREIRTADIQGSPASIAIAQADKKSPVPFVVAQLGRIPIPTFAPRRKDELRENTTIIAYAMPLPHQLNAIVAMLEERHKSR
ncbi:MULTISPECIES: cell wall hydrolase [unclassified Bartonella]|uniref:cell wall hydrolase n=1 Tax=unclassified Bartonella TaxID=2645622 RepID=UPI00099A005A|nr:MULTISPECIES: cell wall hydrolase [unclassified Bartonella]AQX27483.1 Cell wall hydrolase CwlJ, involved in spore germination [Bartonella sp. JB15]AQX28764.1 Cell wall hydrolase CwlJ, involved in spore germination [Bartonella sp. JB63]